MGFIGHVSQPKDRYQHIISYKIMPQNRAVHDIVATTVGYQQFFKKGKEVKTVHMDKS